VALTFDDGPDPASTPRILDELDALGVRATFFLLGEMTERAPDVARRIADDGHEVALHGWHHRNSLRVAPNALRASLARALDVIGDATGVRPTLYRPPYGVVTLGTLRAARSLDLTTVLWGAWGADWAADATPSSVQRTLAPDLAGGATVLLHDSDCTSSPGSWRATLGALRPLVDGVRARGLQVGPLREHCLALPPHRATAWPVGSGRVESQPAG
jgi:peptidoglycan/xylan/chitin deacetylase (PgdA/CDA1 family)